MHIRGGKIDLIMLDRFTWVFVEIRYRRRKRHAVQTPLVAVSILSPLPEAGLNG
ncbi:MAG: YraN family protein [Sodalis sp. (in: enterobacteria)]|uniref:YraN family protein n=1 Tax=Sodalis sp. (in: enterobacteria) TaxID=1898979 RepID=UPI003F32ECA5